MMAKSRIGLLLAGIMVGGATLAQAAAPAPNQMIQFKPRQPGIAISTPAEGDLTNCKVELVQGGKVANNKQASGWLLKDPQGRPLRRFFDSNGDGQVDVWSYYLNGEECYREIDSNFNGKVDQYRWLGANGSKWGADLNEDGVIDSWKMISPEEVSQEVFAAVQTKDFNRLQALMITKADLDSLELPESEANRIRNKVRLAASTFPTTVAALTKLNDKSKWIHLETGAPQCVPADALNGKLDLIHYAHGTILYGDEQNNDFLQTGEMILVGRAWRIVEAPVPGAAVQPQGNNNVGPGVPITDAIKPLIDAGVELDKKYEKANTPDKIAEYNVARAGIFEQIAGKMTGKDQEDFLKQAAECLGVAAQNSDRSALEKLVALQARLVKEQPGSGVAAHVAYLAISAKYTIDLSTAKGNDLPKIQEEQKDRLVKFVQDFPTADVAPDAIMQLAMVSEFMGKENEAKNWYGHMVKNFGKNPLTPRADGALRRLNSEGQAFELAANTLGAKTPFNIQALKGKTVAVYYWASWNGQNVQNLVTDFAKLKATLAAFAGKGVELVCVNLNGEAAEAVAFLEKNPLPATHLFEPGGQENSPLAIHYGVLSLPQLFIVGADGKVITRNAQVSTLDEDLKKIVK